MAEIDFIEDSSDQIDFQEDAEQPKSKPSVPQAFANELGNKIYSEAIAPILEGGSTFAAGVPRLTAKAQGMEKTVFPEQTTIPGKILRGASEIAGFTAGLPGRAAKLAAEGAGKAVEKLTGRALVKRMAQGAAGGAAGMATAGDTIEDRAGKAVAGGIGGSLLAGASPAISKSFHGAGRLLSNFAGIEGNVYKDASRIGFRNVLQKQYFNEKLPLEIQDRIAQNMDDLESAAANKYDNLVNPLRKAKFDLPQFRGDVSKIATKVKINPFETDGTKLDKQILDVVINKAKINNLGDALDFRRNLDNEIYDSTGNLKSKFGKQVRDLLNKELHKNNDLSAVDKDWSSLQDALKQGRKVLGETGEKILDRFGNMTEKQKQMLANLEQEVGGIPFMEDLTKYSLAKKFTTKSMSPSIPGIIRAAGKPILRGYLRGGEGVVNAVNQFDEATIKKFLESRYNQ